MSKLRNISICYTDLVALGKAGHSAFSRHKNGKIYLSVSVWDNDKPNEWGQDVAMQLNPAKDSEDKKVYVGNGKIIKFDNSANYNSAANPIVAEEDEDMPF